MKKLIVSTMLAMGILAMNSAYAQGDKKEACDNCKKTEQCQKAKAKGMKIAKAGANPFEGIQLTDAQQARLKELYQGLGPVVLTKEQQEKIKENKNLTPEQRNQLKEERKAQRVQAKKNYLKGVKETLTPDQYIIFLENCYMAAPDGRIGINQPVKRDAKVKKIHEGKERKSHDGKDKKAKDGKKEMKGKKTAEKKQ